MGISEPSGYQHSLFNKVTSIYNHTLKSNLSCNYFYYITYFKNLTISKKTKAIIAFCFLILAGNVHAVTVQLSATNNSISSCGPRVLTANASNGSGNYSYFWQSSPSSSTDLGNSNTITSTPLVPTTYTVLVLDLGTGEVDQDQVTVIPELTGGFSVLIPTLVTPNGDGYNDRWEIRDGNAGLDPLNAYRYEVTIVNSWGSTVYSENVTVTGIEGVLGGEIAWNANVPDGVYYFSVRLVNCTNDQVYNGNITVLGSSAFASSIAEVNAFPNPATDFLDVKVTTTEVNVDVSKESAKTIDEDPLLAVDTDTVAGNKTEMYTVNIYNNSGDLVKTASTDKKSVRFNINDLKKGKYILKVVQGEETVSRQVLFN